MCEASIALEGSSQQPNEMGTFSYVDMAEDRWPYYKQSGGERYLYHKDGQWRVGTALFGGQVLVHANDNADSPEMVNEWRSYGSGGWQVESFITATCSGKCYGGVQTGFSNINDNCYDLDCGTGVNSWYGELEHAKHLCEKCDCTALHDYNGDNNNWRACSSVSPGTGASVILVQECTHEVENESAVSRTNKPLNAESGIEEENARLRQQNQALRKALQVLMEANEE